MSVTTAPASPPQTDAPPRVHLDYLDGIRAAAAVYVVLHHGWKMVWNERRLPPGQTRMLTSWAEYGHWSVCVFIVLSGFCLMLPVVRGDGTLRGGVGRFFRRRAHRILPPYYFSVLFAVLAAWLFIGEKTGTVWDQSVPITKAGLVTHLLLIHNVFKSTYYQIAFPLWSVAVEWQIYFTFPLLVLLWRRIGGLQATLLTTVIAYVFVTLLHKTGLIGLTPQFYALFALGMLGATVAFSQERSWTAWRERIPWPAATVAAAILLYLLKTMPNGRMVDFFVGLVTFCLLVSVSRPGPNRTRALFSCRPVVWVGTFSYSLYLLHAPILQLVWKFGVHPLHLSAVTTFILMDTVGLAAAIGLSYLFFLACERPFLNTRRTAPRPELVPVGSTSQAG